MKQYQKYHKHTSFSNVYTKDSPLVVRDYLEAFKKEGGNQIYSTVEHGFQSPYFRVYDEIEQFNRENGTNIKFVFGAEIYWVKDRFSNDKSNCHMVLLAKNDRGRKAINKAISIANKTGYYYKPRLDLELILNLPKDDVFVTTACIGYGWFKYDDIDEITLKLNEHFTDFYLEVQAHHTTKQKEVNSHILELSKEYNIPLIAGTDTHILNKQHEEDRDDLLKSAKIEYNSDEADWFMDMPSYDEFVKRFEEQGVLSYDEIITAIENTNLILDFEDIVLDRSIKIPTLYPELNQEEKDRLFIKRIFDLWKEESKKIAPSKHDYYKSEIMKEIQEIIGCGMCDYFLTNEKIIRLAVEKYGGEITQSGRGCFTESALVHTKKTLKSIKDIEVGDYVVTKDGNFNKVVDTMKYEIEEEMVKINHLYGNSEKQPSICTKDHKILINRDGNVDWIEAQNIQKGDYVCVPKIKTSGKFMDGLIDLNNYNSFGYEFDDNYIYEKLETTGKGYPYSQVEMAKILNISGSTINKFTKRGYQWSCPKETLDKLSKISELTPFKDRDEYISYLENHKIRKINRYIKVDEEFNRFIGLMYGDGFTMDRCIALAVNTSNHKNIVNREIFTNICNSVGGIFADRKEKNRNLGTLYLHSKVFTNFFKTEIFTSKLKREKIFNSDLYYQDQSCILALIEGLRLSDGSKEGTRISFDNNSLSLINAYKLLCLIAEEGVNAITFRGKSETKEGYICSESYKLRMSTNQIFDEPKGYYDVWKDDNYYFLAVKNIELLPKQKVTVYDMTVENEHNYLLNNMIVHNSNVAFYLNKLLGFTNIDRISAPIDMYSERFLTKERVLESKTPPDEDFNVSDRMPFIQAQRDLLGETSCYDLIAFGTLKFKSAFKMYARANEIEPSIANEITKQIDKYEKALLYAEEDDKEFINIYDYVNEEEYGYVIEGCQRYLGIIDTRKAHPCGSLSTSCDIEEEVGIILCKSETTGKEVLTALIESGTIDSFGWLKNDFLIVDSTRLINAVYKKIGMKPIEINDLLEMIKDDKAVWEIYEKGYSQCINQIEQSKTTQKTMRYKPRNIVELTKLIAGIRPSFKSLYSKFESRERFQYDIPVLDKLLQNEYSDSSFILFQEDLMKILNFAGFPMKDTYTIIKAISKKKKKVISKVKPKFIKTFAEHILAEGGTDEEANAIAEKIWGIVEDFSSYGFNSPHGFSYAVDSVTQAWQKAHYPYEFYEVVLQRFTEKGEKAKVSLIKQEMKHFNIKLKPIKFRDDNRTFTSYKDKGYITQPLNNIKNISKTTPDTLYELRNLEVNNFVDFLIYTAENELKLDKTNMEILIKLDYFEEFGTIDNLLSIYKLFKKEYNAKRTQKTKDKKIELLREYERTVNIETSVFNKMKYQIEVLGYTDIVCPEFSDNLAFVTGIETNQYGTPFGTFYQVNTGKVVEGLKMNKFFYERNLIKVGDLILLGKINNQKKAWIKDREEFELVLSNYREVIEE